MATRSTEIQTKITALLGKDLDGLVSKKVHIPFLGSDYTRAELEAWLSMHAKVLQDIAAFTDKQISDARSAKFSELKAQEKTAVDAFLSDPKRIQELTRAQYEKFMPFILLKHAIG